MILHLHPCFSGGIFLALVVVLLGADFLDHFGHKSPQLALPAVVGSIEIPVALLVTHYIIKVII